MEKIKVLKYVALISLIVAFSSVMLDLESTSANLVTQITLPIFGISWVWLQVEKRKKKK